MKFLKYLFLTSALMAALVLSGCSNKELVSAKEDRDTVLAAAAKSSDKLLRAAEAVQKENDQLRSQLQTLVGRTEGQAKQIEDLKLEIRMLQQNIGVVESKVAAEQAEAGKGLFSGTFLLIVGILLALVVIVLIILWARPKPFEEEEDDDLSQFDDDFGFDDEDDEEDFFEGDKKDDKKDGE